MIELIKEALSSTLDNPRFVLCGVFLAFTGFFNACLDRLDNVGAFSTSVFRNLNKSFWLKPDSANNKYKRHASGRLYVDHYTPDNKPIFKPAFKFLGLRSDRSLVFLTDGWHLAQFFQWSSVCLACSFATGMSPKDWRFWLFFILIRSILTGTFSAFYSSVFRRR